MVLGWWWLPRCFVVLFASSALRFVWRTKSVNNHPTDAKVVKAGSAGRPNRGKGVDAPFSKIQYETGPTPRNPITQV
jgi:hypothetical protein